MMKLCILRHGIAAELGEDGSQVDSERKLTREGREKLKCVADALGEMEMAFDLILSSPYARARQTAEQVAARLKCEKRLKFSKQLEPGAAFESVTRPVRLLEESVIYMAADGPNVAANSGRRRPYS